MSFVEVGRFQVHAAPDQMYLRDLVDNLRQCHQRASNLGRPLTVEFEVSIAPGGQTELQCVVGYDDGR